MRKESKFKDLTEGEVAELCAEEDKMKKTGESFWIYFAQYLPSGKMTILGTSCGLINVEVWKFYAGFSLLDNFLITAVEQPI